jgi:TolB-like protein/DNA-binding winged helix-turn-helix (wHTH) protein/Flp pilus assembly protein TadD
MRGRNLQAREMCGVTMVRGFMTDPHSEIITIGPWRVETATGRVSDGTRELSLRPRDIDVLLSLARRDGEVVSVDDLINDAWHGAVVSNDALYFSISQLRKALDDPAAEQSIIENMPKRGYRVAVPVQIAPAQVAGANGSAPAIGTPAPGRPAGGRKWLLLAAGLAAIAIGLLSTQYWSGIDEPDGNSIAVMPFIDLSPDTDHTYLSDGISEELLSRLARVPGLQVAARTSSFAFKDQATDVVDIGRSLGVASILEGSVRKDGDRVRVAVQLIDANSGFRIWSETYDRQLGSVFVLQNEIARRVIDALEPALSTGADNPHALSAQSADPAAIEPYLMGLEQQHLNTFSSLQRAANLFAEAVDLDPSFSQAHTALAETKLGLIDIGASFDHTLIDEAKALANQALAHDPGSSEAYRIMAKAKVMSGEYELAGPLLQKALDLSPSNSAALIDFAQLRVMEGDKSAARQYMQRALRIDPYGSTLLMKLGHLHWADGRADMARDAFERGALVHPQNPIFPMLLGILQVLNYGELAGGLQNFLLAAELDPRDFEIAAYVAMTYLTLGMLEDARPWIDRAIKLGPLAATSLALESSWLAQSGDPSAAANLSVSVLDDARFIYRGHELLWEPHYVFATSGLIANGRAAEALELLDRNRELRINRFAPAGDGGGDGEPDDGIRWESKHTRWMLSKASAYRAAGDRAALANTLATVERHAGTQTRHMHYRGAGQSLLQAEIRALEGKRDAALDLLEQVVDSGPVFNWQARIGYNAAFTDLHDSERYTDLLDEMRSSVALQRQRLPAMAHMSQTRLPPPLEFPPE